MYTVAFRKAACIGEGVGCGVYPCSYLCPCSGPTVPPVRKPGCRPLPLRRGNLRIRDIQTPGIVRLSLISYPSFRMLKDGCHININSTSTYSIQHAAMAILCHLRSRTWIFFHSSADSEDSIYTLNNNTYGILPPPAPATTPTNSNLVRSNPTTNIYLYQHLQRNAAHGT